MKKIRIVMADDHPVVRQGIRALLETSDQVEVVGEASDGLEALAMVDGLRPDILLLDMEMPDMSGVDVVRRLKTKGVEVRILVLSAYDDPHYIRSVLANGASGYLTKDEAPAYVLEAVSGVWRGQKAWLSPKIAAKMKVWTVEKTKDLGLTGRELQVLRGVVDAKTDQEIGLTLSISNKTVEKHMESIFTKMGVGSRVEAAVLAMREEIFEG